MKLYRNLLILLAFGLCSAYSNHSLCAFPVQEAVEEGEAQALEQIVEEEIDEPEAAEVEVVMAEGMGDIVQQELNRRIASRLDRLGGSIELPEADIEQIKMELEAEVDKFIEAETNPAQYMSGSSELVGRMILDHLENDERFEGKLDDLRSQIESTKEFVRVTTIDMLTITLDYVLVLNQQQRDQIRVIIDEWVGDRDLDVGSNPPYYAGAFGQLEMLNEVVDSLSKNESVAEVLTEEQSAMLGELKQKYEEMESVSGMAVGPGVDVEEEDVDLDVLVVEWASGITSLHVDWLVSEHELSERQERKLRIAGKDAARILQEEKSELAESAGGMNVMAGGTMKTMYKMAEPPGTSLNFCDAWVEHAEKILDEKQFQAFQAEITRRKNDYRINLAAVFALSLGDQIADINGEQLRGFSKMVAEATDPEVPEGIFSMMLGLVKVKDEVAEIFNEAQQDELDEMLQMIEMLEQEVDGELEEGLPDAVDGS